MGVTGLPAIGAFAAGLAAATIGCDRSTPSPPVQADRIAPNDQRGDQTMPWVIRSAVFAHGEAVPRRFTGDGDDVSPPLSWSGTPDGARELALICDDPDAPTPTPWVHWVIYKIPVTAVGLREDVSKLERPPEPAGALQGRNSWNKVGYGGPAPPRGHGVHHYHFKLYALDRPLDVAAGLDKDRLLAAMQGHIIGQCELVGTYQR